MSISNRWDVSSIPLTENGTTDTGSFWNRTSVSVSVFMFRYASIAVIDVGKALLARYLMR